MMTMVTMAMGRNNSGILPSLVSHKAKMFEAATDSQGVEPKNLEQLLSNWSTSPSTSSHPFPKFLYTTPTGANPSGTSASDERKREILTIIRKYKMLLLEDDPYYFLSFEGLTADADAVTRVRGKSYFQLEAESKEEGSVGRVVRFDSFSKILSAGLRLGFVTGPREVLDAIDLDTSSRNLQTSGTSQAIAYALLSKWGIDGFLTHADNVARFYQVSNHQHHRHWPGLHASLRGCHTSCTTSFRDTASLTAFELFKK